MVGPAIFELGGYVAKELALTYGFGTGAKVISFGRNAAGELIARASDGRIVKLTGEVLESTKRVLKRLTKNPDYADDATRTLAKLDDVVPTRIVDLAEANIANTGKTVLGHFPGYIDKAKARGASYFDIGNAWNTLSESERWAANRHFLDKISESGDQVFLSLPKSQIREGSYLAKEIQYLISEKGYRWINQWTLRK